MPPVVILATARLRHGLLDLLADVANELHEALLPLSGALDVTPAQTHYVKVRAIGDLLDEIGWVLDEIAPPFTLDIPTHGWAATTALQRVIAREYFSTWRYAAVDEPEESGQAAGFRRDAERELGLIHAACDQAKVTITAPAP